MLEDQRVRRLGGKTEIQLDVRVIASTNSPLEAAMRENKFREDLFYRLNVFPVPLPPLRERLEDIPALVSALLADMNRKHSIKVAEASPNVLDILRTHTWPGNVRELRNVIERAAILAGEGTIRPEHLPPVFHQLHRARFVLPLLQLPVTEVNCAYRWDLPSSMPNAPSSS